MKQRQIKLLKKNHIPFVFIYFNLYISSKIIEYQYEKQV